MSFGQELVAHYSLQALDANGVARMTSTLRSNKVFRAYPDRWGWNKFANREMLTRRGLLEGNSLRLRVTVTLVATAVLCMILLGPWGWRPTALRTHIVNATCSGVLPSL